ncbi:MAG: nuclear transport factor 2 family protein [Parachlamydiaceae bacterium]|nr:nuclear transport factor 2 family protein [Parachlamydiaceae bacterium]
MKIRSLFFGLLIFCLNDFQNAQAQEIESESKIKSQVISRLQRWPKDFNEKNISGVCDIFSADLNASYPGRPDKNYNDMCRQLTTVLMDNNKQYRYEDPKIEQIIVDKDLAIVRVRWILVKNIKGQSGTEFIKEKGIDVLKRQADGQWKIIISHAYPEVEIKKQSLI